MAELNKVNAPVRKPLFEGVQGENEARSIQFDVTPWVEELGDGVVTATAKRSQDSQPYPVTVTKIGNTVTWKPTSTDTAFAGVGSFQLEYTVDSVLAKTCIWSTMVAPSLDPAGDPPDPYDNWLAEMRQIAADALQSEQNADTSAKTSEAWAVGQRGGVDVPSTDPAYENNAKYWAEQSAANQYAAFIVKSASGEIASFSDGADDVPMKSLNVTITPKQSGSGDPSPSNIRPITGWTDINLNDSPYAINDKVNITGKNIYNAPNNLLDTLVPCHIAVGTRVVISCAVTSNCGIRLYNSAKQFIDNWTMTGTQGGRYYRAFTAASSIGDIEYVEFYGANTVKDLMIETGATTPSPYSPYGTHTPVPLGQTVYGGTVEVVDGEGSKNIEMVAINDIGFGTATIGGHTIFRGLNHFAVSQNVAGLCECLKPTTESLANMPNNSYRFSTYWDGNARLAIRADGYADVTALKTALGANKIAIPVNPYGDFTFTPAQVASLLGDNNVWSDAGAVEVEYRADPTLAYNELANVIVSLGGNL